MLSYRLGTVNDFHWEFKPVLSYSKPHTFGLNQMIECKSMQISSNYIYAKYVLHRK